MVVTPTAIIITVEDPNVTMTTNAGLGSGPAPAAGRKRRLAHLSMEEKLHRKKLKNRVAAQTSRDRKKARMDELEYSVSLLTSQSEELTSECSKLRLQNEALTTENTSLRQELQDVQATMAALLENFQAGSTTCGCGRPSQTAAVTATQSSADNLPPNMPRPAESNGLPLLKGQGGQGTAGLRALQMLLTAAFLLSRSCSQTSGQKTSQTCPTLSALQRACSKMQLISPVKSSEMWEKWWGRHQKMWNPVDQLPLQAVMRPTLRAPS